MTPSCPVNFTFWRLRVEILRSVLNFKIAIWTWNHIHYRTCNRLKATKHNSRHAKYSSSRHPLKLTHRAKSSDLKCLQKMLIFLERKTKRALNRSFSPHQNILHHFHSGLLFIQLFWRTQTQIQVIKIVMLRNTR